MSVFTPEIRLDISFSVLIPKTKSPGSLEFKNATTDFNMFSLSCSAFFYDQNDSY